MSLEEALEAGWGAEGQGPAATWTLPGGGPGAAAVAAAGAAAAGWSTPGGVTTGTPGGHLVSRTLTGSQVLLDLPDPSGVRGTRLSPFSSNGGSSSGGGRGLLSPTPPFHSPGAGVQGRGRGFHPGSSFSGSSSGLGADAAARIARSTAASGAGGVKVASFSGAAAAAVGAGLVPGAWMEASQAGQQQQLQQRRVAVFGSIWTIWRVGSTAVWPWSSTLSRTAFVYRFGYLLDDLLGDELTGAVQRSTAPVLLFYPLSLLHRYALAWTFGLGHYLTTSGLQLALLLVTQGCFICYVATVRPLALPILQWGEVIALGAELTILAGAAALLRYPGQPSLTRLLVVCYFLDVACLVVPELLRLLVCVVTWWRRRRLRRAAQDTAAAATAAAAAAEAAGQRRKG